MFEDKILTLNDVKALNAETAPIVVLHSTKGQNADIIKQLNKNVSIQILGGYAGPVYKNTKYENRTFYTPSQVAGIINVYEQIEQGIKENWTDLEKAYFMYCTIVLHLNYDYQNSIQENIENSKIFKLFIDNPHLSQAHLDFRQKLLQECNKIDNIPIIYRNLCTIFTRKSHCSGFANCLKEGLDRIGIENHINHIPNFHTFNSIKINDLSLIADPTFEKNQYDDCKKSNKYKNSLKKYFGTYSSMSNYLDEYFPFIESCFGQNTNNTSKYLTLSQNELTELKKKILPEVLLTIRQIKLPLVFLEKPIQIKSKSSPTLNQ